MVVYESKSSTNLAHTLSYSIVGVQEANLALHYPRIYWNTANLISDSGGEDGNTNYGKMSVAIANIQKEGINVALPDLNRVRFGFHPDAEKNEIVFGLKGIQNISDILAREIFNNAPYSSLDDFLNKMQKAKENLPNLKVGNKAITTLIKAGAFDTIENKSRVDVMKDYIQKVSQPLTSLSWSNVSVIKELDLLTPSQIEYEYRLYNFKKYVTNRQFFVFQKGKSAATNYYYMEPKFAAPFFFQYIENEMVEKKDYEYDDLGRVCVKKGSLDRVFNKLTASFKTEVLNNNSILDKVNKMRYNDVWEEKVSGKLSKWEMDSLGYYFSEHELTGVNREQYNICNFFEMSEKPEVESWFVIKGQNRPRFKLFRIAGTVLDRDKNHHTISLLTLDGVVQIKFYKGQFSFYDRQLSEIDEDSGSKTVLEKSWFSRGNKLLVTGYRRDDQFIPKQYKDSIYNHSVQFITDLKDNGELILQDERTGANDEEN